MLKTTAISRPQSTCHNPLLSLLEKCSSMKQLKQIHAKVIALGLSSFTYIASRIQGFCAAHDNGDLTYARQLFDTMPQPTIFNWNIMIKGYSKSPVPDLGLFLYAQMRFRGVEPNMHTFPFTVRSCQYLSELLQIHGHIFKFGFDTDVYVTSSLIMEYSNRKLMELALRVFDECTMKNTACWTTLLTGYCSNSMMEKAREIFDQMPEKNDVAWSALISGYVQNNCHEEAIVLFNQLRKHKSVRLNGSLLVSALRACAATGAVEDGRWIHSYIDEQSSEYGLKIGTALVDFYLKCGILDLAKEVFDKIPSKDITAWSAMITGLALNGHSQTAIDTFSVMLSSRVKPNSVTFIGVLTACNHGGLVNQGKAYFEKMINIYGIIPTSEHYGCMVDLLSRAGKISEADEMIRSMPIEPDGAIWGALLSGCLMHGNTELADRVAKNVIRADQQHSGRYIGLANAYSAMGKWDSAVRVRKDMRKRKVITAVGWSSIGNEATN